MMKNNIITLVIFMTSITIKGINDEIYRRFRALATLRGISIQKALEEAMVLWIKQGTILIDVGEIDAIMDIFEKIQQNLLFMIHLEELLLRRIKNEQEKN